MPIVSRQSTGIRRYAIFSFVENPEAAKSKGATSYNESVQLAFLKCPLTSPMEVATKLAHTELFHMKRLSSLEKHVLCPYVDVTFFTSYQPVAEIRNFVDKKDCINLHDPNIHLQKAMYEELQLVDPKRDMINTPIDADDLSGDIQEGRTFKNLKSQSTPTDDTKRLRGYIIIAYKTMEDMYSREFVSTWKTWTGVRYICMQLPRQLDLRRISFYRQVSRTSTFQYVLCMEISNLLVYAAQTLNLMDRIKLRLCGYLGLYREIDYRLDPATASYLNLPVELSPPPSAASIEEHPRITVSRYNSAEKSVGEQSVHELSLPEVKGRRPLPPPPTGTMGKEDKNSEQTTERPKKSVTRKPLKRQEKQVEKTEKEMVAESQAKPAPRESKQEQKEPKKSSPKKHLLKRQEVASFPSTESITSTEVSSTASTRDTSITSLRISAETHKEVGRVKSDEGQTRSKPVEADVVHSQIPLKPSRFVGHGRICHGDLPPTPPVCPLFSETENMVPELQSRQDSVPNDYCMPMAGFTEKQS